MKTTLQVIVIIALLALCGFLGYLIWNNPAQESLSGAAAPIATSTQVYSYPAEEVINLFTESYPKTFTSSSAAENARLATMLQACKSKLANIHAFPGYKYQELSIRQQYLGYPEDGQNALVSPSGKIELLLTVGGAQIVSLADSKPAITTSDGGDYHTFDLIYDSNTGSCITDTETPSHSSLNLVPTEIAEQVLENATKADTQIAAYNDYDFQPVFIWSEQEGQLHVSVALIKGVWRTSFVYNLATGAITNKEEPKCTRIDQLSPSCDSYKE